MRQYVIALDQGTTSSRCILFDADESIAAMAQKEDDPDLTPRRAGWQQDPMEIYATIYGTMSEALAQGNIQPGQIAAIGITNQRETTILWDGKTGEPVYNAIVWQCRRTADRVPAAARAQGLGPMVAGKDRPFRIDGIFFRQRRSRWILDQRAPGAAAGGTRAAASYAARWIPGCSGSSPAGRRTSTDYTNASRTMLFNIHTLHWDDELLDRRCRNPPLLSCRKCATAAAYSVWPV